LLVTARPECFFKGEVLLNLDPKKARITSLIVGVTVAFGIGSAAPAFVKEAQHERAEVACPACWPGQSITATVQFLEDCTWSGTLLGKGLTTAEVLPAVEEAFKGV
jgi:hypothetical protein